MKTQEEIEKLAETAFQDELIKSNQNINWIGYGKGIDGTSKERWIRLWIKGYTHQDNDWTKGCECENSIGQTWCCNQCGLPYDTRKSDKIYTEEDLHTILRLRKEWYSHTDKNVVRDFIKIKQDK